MSTKSHIARITKHLLVAIVIGGLALAVRLPGAGSFMTADEENWMIRSGEYYHNLFRKHDTGGAFMTTHPGATGMWLIGGGIALQEQRLGIDIDTGNRAQFRRAAVLPIVAATSLMIAIIGFLLVELRGVRDALIAGGLLAVQPYLTGLSQIAHLDALLALFMVATLIAFLVWAKAGGQRWLAIAGIFAGLALGTKLLPALWLFVVIGLYLLYRLARRKISWSRVVRIAGFFFGIAVVTFYIVWPALWRTADVGRSFEKDVPSVITDSHVEFELAEEPIQPATFYFRAIAGRTTPIILLLVAAAGIGEIIHITRKRTITQTGWLLIYAIGFLALITFVAKKGDRYGLPAFAALPLIAGFEVARLAQYIPARGMLATWKTQIAGAVIGILLLTTTLSWSPYAIAYASPLFSQDIRPLSQQGWGEGLDEAAAWFNQSPFIDRLYVSTWYPDVLGTYFNGKAASLSARDDKRMGYVVLYRNMGGRAQDTIASDVLDEFKDKTPEHIIYIKGVPYVWIYNNLGPYYFRQHVGELAGSVEAGQLVPVSKGNWSRIDFAIATFSSRANTEDVILEIRENIDDATPIRTSVVNARTMQDEEFQAFTFDPIPDSAGKTYYVSLRSPTSYLGNAITVRYASEDVLPGQLVLRRNTLLPTEARSDFIRDGDLGYRLP